MPDDAQPKRHAPKGRIKAQPDDPSINGPKKRRPPRILCTGHTSAGRPCGRPPIRGGSVCATHGGSAPQVRLKAEERLLALQAPAIVRLQELMEQREFPSVAIAATKDVLDRTMGKALERVESGKPGDFSPLTDEELQERLSTCLALLAKP